MQLSNKLPERIINMTKRILTPEEELAYRIMIAIAHKAKGQSYTTADLLNQVNHSLNGESQKRIGTKFAFYAVHQDNIYIERGKGNNRYYTHF